MTLTGVFINAGGVFLAGILGGSLRKGLPESLRSMLMNALALCILFIGISGIPSDTSFTRVVISVAAGTLIGTLLDIDGKLNGIGDKVQKLLPIKDEGFTEAFVSATLFVCVGALSIVGGIESGTKGTYEVFVAKTFIDTIVVFVMATTKGSGCALSAVITLIYQLLITLLASFISRIVDAETIAMMSQIGSLLVTGVALNMLGTTDIKVGNLVLCPFIPVFFGLL